MRDQLYTESQIKMVATSCTSNQQAANFLNINKETWKKYAKMYIEPESGLNYYEYVKNKKNGKLKYKDVKDLPFNKMLSGERPCAYHKKSVIMNKLFQYGLKLKQCDMCGYNQSNVVSGDIPITLNFLDDDDRNGKLENLEILCFNCAATTTNIKIYTNDVIRRIGNAGSSDDQPDGTT